MMREFLAPFVDGHPSREQIFDRETPTVVISRGFSSTEMDQEMDHPFITLVIQPRQPFITAAPHRVSHPVQEHRPCSDHPNQEDESLGRPKRERMT